MAKVMQLVDPRVLAGLQPNCHVENPIHQTLSTLDAEMQHILKSDMPNQEKVTEYNRVLQRYLEFQDQRHESSGTPSGSSTGGASGWLSGRPSEGPIGFAYNLEAEVLRVVPKTM